MSDLYWLSDAQMARLTPFFPKSHGKPRVDDRRVPSGIIFINRNSLRWRDAPTEYGPHKTLYNLWKRWRDKGIFAQMLIGLAADHGEPKMLLGLIGITDIEFIYAQGLALGPNSEKAELQAANDRIDELA